MMNYKLTRGAFTDLTDHTFTRDQVIRILAELDALALETDPRNPERVNVCQLRSFPGLHFRLRIHEDGLKCRLMFDVDDGKQIIVVWAALVRCQNTYDIARIFLQHREAI